MLEVKKRITKNPVYHSAQTCKVVKKLSMTQLLFSRGVFKQCNLCKLIIDSEFTFI